MVAEWNRALLRLRETVGERNFTTWIEPIHCTQDAMGLRLEVASRFILDWVTNNFLESIRAALAELGNESPLRMVVGNGGLSEMSRLLPPTRPAPPLAKPRKPQIGHSVPDYTFDSFVVGATNVRTYRAIQSIADAPGRRFNPLFVWGGVGLGKTHLVHALANELLRRARRLRVGCISAESFMNSLIGSLKQDHMAAFRDRFRVLDTLILDDVQFLAGKERTQEEFFHTFNALYEAGKQVVLTSDKPPHAISQLEQRLRSRFEGGLIADILPPTPEMRLAILSKKAALHGTQLDDETAAVIAERSGPSVRELEGALNRVVAVSELESVALTPDLASNVLGCFLPIHQAISVEEIQKHVSAYFGLALSDLTSHSRERHLVLPRQIAMYLCRTVADASFPAIAGKFGGRDHSTVMHAVKVVEDKRTQDAASDQLLKLLERGVRSPARARKSPAPSVAKVS